MVLQEAEKIDEETEVVLLAEWRRLAAITSASLAVALIFAQPLTVPRSGPSPLVLKRCEPLSCTLSGAPTDASKPERRNCPRDVGLLRLAKEESVSESAPGPSCTAPMAAAGAAACAMPGPAVETATELL